VPPDRDAVVVGEADAGSNDEATVVVGAEPQTTAEEIEEEGLGAHLKRLLRFRNEGSGGVWGMRTVRNFRTLRDIRKYVSSGSSEVPPTNFRIFGTYVSSGTYVSYGRCMRGGIVVGGVPRG